MFGNFIKYLYASNNSFKYFVFVAVIFVGLVNTFHIVHSVLHTKCFCLD